MCSVVLFDQVIAFSWLQNSASIMLLVLQAMYACGPVRSSDAPMAGLVIVCLCLALALLPSFFATPNTINEICNHEVKKPSMTQEDVYSFETNFSADLSFFLSFCLSVCLSFCPYFHMFGTCLNIPSKLCSLCLVPFLRHSFLCLRNVRRSDLWSFASTWCGLVSNC